ncbi:MAG: toll/interleukin-1 receptor domain-containing protein [Acidimicrobiales bacterium]
MGGIFISYRREDSAPYARLLSDSLGAHFGPEQIFRDIDTIGPGVDFPEAIADAVGSCKVLLAVIGDKWLMAQQDGRRRLDNEGDYVRLEIAAALERDVLVVPVLLEQARMPGKADLPPNLAELADRNAVRLTDNGWHDGVRRLAAGLEKPLGVVARGDGPAPTPGHSTPSPSPGWGPGTPAPSSWTQTPLPEPATRVRTGREQGGKKNRRLTLIVVGLVALAVIMVLGFIAGGDPEDGDQDVIVDETTETVEPEANDSSVTLGTIPRTTIGRVTLDPNLLRLETELTVAPTSGPFGTTVALSGSGFAANERVELLVGSDRLGETTADDKGAFSGVRLRVPTVIGSDVFFRAEGAKSFRSAFVQFRVT